MLPTLFALLSFVFPAAEELFSISRKPPLSTDVSAKKFKHNDITANTTTKVLVRHK